MISIDPLMMPLLMEAWRRAITAIDFERPERGCEGCELLDELLEGIHRFKSESEVVQKLRLSIFQENYREEMEESNFWFWNDILNPPYEFIPPVLESCFMDGADAFDGLSPRERVEQFALIASPQTPY